MPQIFEGSRAKTARALQHFDTLDREIRAFIDSGAYGVVGYLNQQTGWKEINFEIHKPPPIEWGLIVGEIAHNLRSALDHIVFALSGGKNGTQFPIFLSSDRYFERDRHGKIMLETMLRGVDSAYRTIIDNAQPFHRPRPLVRDDPLARLSWLNNADKHRLIHGRFTIFSRFGDLDVEILDDTATSVETDIVIRPMSVLEDQTPLYRIRSLPNPAAEVKVKSQVPLRIGFGKGAPRVETSHIARIIEYVRDVISRLEAV